MKHAWVWLGLLAACASEPEQQKNFGLLERATLRLVRSEEGEVIGVRCVHPDARPEQGERWLSVHVVPTGGANPLGPPMAGDYEVCDTGILFRPRFGFDKGRVYCAYGPEFEIVPRVWDRTAIRFGSRGEHEGPVARVDSVSPSASRLPENLLRFYIRFSEPMSIGRAYEYMELLNERGDPVPDAFLEIGEELWDPEGRRLTLLFDPARVKRGLVPHEEQGRALVAGRTYTLRIDRAWPDAHGRPLLAEYRKRFETFAEDLEPPSLERWDLFLAEVGSRGAIRVEFGEPLDQEQLLDLIYVQDERGRVVDGERRVGIEAASWSFVPAEPWREVVYQLIVDSALEDLVGNSLRGPFEIDRFDRVEEKPHGLMRREFTPRREPR